MTMLLCRIEVSTAGYVRYNLRGGLGFQGNQGGTAEVTFVPVDEGLFY
jgi:hypothetical protein